MTPRCDYVVDGRPCGAGVTDRVGRLWLCAWHVDELLARDRVRSAWYGLAIGALLVACALVDQAHPLTSTPLTQAFFGLIITGVVAVFQWLAGAAVTVAVTVAQAAIMIGTAIAHFSILVAGVFSRVWGYLSKFWGNVLRPFVGWAWKQIQALHTWLKNTLKPLVDFIERVRKYVDAIYQRWLKPILDTIEATRRVFQLLAQLHVPWAREIDRKLASVESRLLAPIRELYARLNEAMNWINRIVDFNGYFQRLTLIASLMRYQADALKVWWTSVHHPLAGAKLEAYRKPLETRTIAQVSADARAYVVLHDGPDVERIDEHVDDLRLRLQRAQGSI